MNLDEARVGYHPKRVADWRAGNIIGPIYVELSPTNVCNHKCTFCAYRHLKAPKQEWSLERAMQVGGELARAGVKAVMIAGEGEPCLYPHMKVLVTFLHHAGIKVAITTNGSQDMTEYAEYCDWIRISFNGSTAEEYKAMHGVDGFDIALQNTMNICGLTKTQMQMVYVGQDIGNMNKLIRTVGKAGVRTFQIKQYNAMAAQDDHPTVQPLTTEQVRQLRGEWFSNGIYTRVEGLPEVIVRSGLAAGCERPYKACYALDFQCEILSNYDINGCQVMKGTEDYRWGNIESMPFDEAWHSSASKRRQTILTSPRKGCMDRCRPHQNNEWLWRLQKDGGWDDFI